MSDPVPALRDAQFDGLVRITARAPQGMITLRGDLGAASVIAAATEATGLDMPDPLRANCTDDHGLCWMSPDELLVLCPYDAVATALGRMHETLAETHALAVDMSDARASFLVTGPHIRDVLAKITPADLTEPAFTIGTFRRTRLAQVPGAFWLRDNETLQLICFRSVAGYVFDLLRSSAHPSASVGFH